MFFGKKEQKRQQEELQKKVTEFNKELSVLLDKYHLVLVPALSVTKQGIIPVFNVAPKKDEA